MHTGGVGGSHCCFRGKARLPLRTQSRYGGYAGPVTAATRRERTRKATTVVSTVGGIIATAVCAVIWGWGVAITTAILSVLAGLFAVWLSPRLYP